MTTKTEQAKREMYDLLESMRRAKKNPAKLARFEDALEAHLEALRQDHEFMKSQLMTCRDINCGLQLRIQALEHAAHVNGQANLAAGDELREAQALILSQRQAIADMYMRGTKANIKYWLCCGSKNFHHQASGRSCNEASSGHPERCRWGTADEHSAWQKGEMK